MTPRARTPRGERAVVGAPAAVRALLPGGLRRPAAERPLVGRVRERGNHVRRTPDHARRTPARARRTRGGR